MTSANDQPVPRWVRIVMVAALAVPQMVIGGWALLAPRHWYDEFPGFGLRLVAAEPPFNQHLATDVGAGFLAIGVGMLVAAILATRSGVYVAVAAFAAFALPHAIYHLRHPSPELSGPQNVSNVALLGGNLVWLALVVRGVRPRRAVNDQSDAAAAP